MTFFDLFCRILDKLKSSSAEAQIQVGRLSEDLSQAKVNAIKSHINFKLHIHSCKLVANLKS